MRIRAQPHHHRVYVVELSKDVLFEPRFRKEYLTPGEGADAWVSWDHEKADVSDEFAMGSAPPWAKRAPWVALVHELIHAWRIATGRVAFHPTTPYYHEEAMTVGLVPYDRCEFTENPFRTLGVEARRSFYGPESKLKTEKAEKKYASK